MFSCEFCKIFKNTYFLKHLWSAASECLWCNKVLPYPCWINIWQNFIKRHFLLTCPFLVLECCLQFREDFLYGILLWDFLSQNEFILRMWSSLENYTSNHTTQHETTQVQHETTRVQNNIKFTLIYLYHRYILGAWHVRL